MSWLKKIINKLFKKSKKKELTYLEKLKSESKVMLGHHDDTLVGRKWLSPIGKSDIYDVIDSYPAVMEFDLMGIELGRTNYTDDITFDDIKNEAIKQHERDGYICFSWHMFNPQTGKNVYDLGNNTVSNILTNETVHNTFWDGINKAISFLETLKDSEGNQIPFMLRPFHECLNKSTMWWVSNQCTSEEYIELWRQVHNTFKQHFGNNILFIYSPCSTVISKEDYLSYYPGNDYVDILGIEEYQHYDSIDKSRYNLVSRLNYNLGATKKIADSLNKPYALTEAGIYINHDPNVWTECYNLIQNYKPLFINLWRNANENKPGLCYAPYPGEKSENDFKEFCNNLKTVK